MPATTFDRAIVTDLMEDAIEFCARKTSFERKDQALETLRGGDCSACDYLRYGLAKGVAGYLGSVDDTIKAIYTYEPEYASDGRPIPDQPNLTPGINLIAWVSRKSAALSSIVASLNSALADEYERLGCPKANALCHTLDLRMVNDEEVRERAGYGALISSVYVRPLEVWRR